MIAMLALAMLGQAVAVAAPPSPAWPQAERIAADLKHACMSDAGIAIAIKLWTHDQEAAKARQPASQAIERELGEAAYAVPIDVDRLERAAKARDADQAERLDESLSRSIMVMRQLSPGDRAIYARRLSIYRPELPTRTCAERGMGSP